MSHLERDSPARDGVTAGFAWAARATGSSANNTRVSTRRKDSKPQINNRLSPATRFIYQMGNAVRGHKLYLDAGGGVVREARRIHVRSFSNFQIGHGRSFGARMLHRRLTMVRKPIKLRGNCRPFEGIKLIRIAQTDGNRRSEES